MKKILLTALVAVAALTANAQVWVGGSIGYQHYDIDGAASTKIDQFKIQPEIGYTLSDKIDLAIAIGYQSVKDNIGTTGFNYVNDKGEVEAVGQFYVNPYVRYTFFQTGAVGFFVDGGFSITTDSRQGAKAEFGIGVAPGVKFAASVGGLGYRMNQGNRDKAKYYGLGLDNKLSFGLYYSF